MAERPVALPPVFKDRSALQLTDRERYLAGFHNCAARFEMAANVEIRSIWATMARSYQLLLDREDRLEREAHERPDGYFLSL